MEANTPVIHQFVQNIREGKNFSLVKFGDSELLCMDNRPGSNGDNHPFSPDLCLSLNLAYDSLSKQPESYFAEWTGPWKELYPHRNVSFVEYETLLPTVHNPDLTGLFEFYKAIKESKRRKVYVGPARSRPAAKMLGVDVFLEVPLYNCWEQYEYIRTKLMPEKDCIIMFSCTMLANVLIADVYDGTRTCLDCGSAFDPYCGIQNRERQMTPLEAKRYFESGIPPVPSTQDNTYFVHIRNPRTGEYYTSYDDYFRLVKLSGFKECDLLDVNPRSNNTYIFTLNYDGLFQEPIGDVYFPADRRARYIHHQIERYNIIDERFDQILLSDKSMPELMHPKARYMPLGGHPDFIEPLEIEKATFDFYHMCYPVGRRMKMLSDMHEKGFTFADQPGETWEQKNKALQSVKMGLALHQHEDSLELIEPLRLTVFSCAKLPILAEPSTDFYPYRTFNYEQFLATPNIDSLVASGQGQENYELMTQKYTFENCFEEILKR